MFTRSPDGRRVAYRGFQPHFGPPFAKSDTLDVDGGTLYPVGGSHLVSGDPDDPRIWRGIHEFQTPLQWSPDSRSIAFIERTFDFHSVGDCLVGCPENAFLNERWWAVVLDLSGKVRREEVKKGATMVWAPEARRFRVH